MLYINLPTREELLDLADVRSDACVSIYLNVSPLPQEAHASRIELGNLIKQALASLHDAGLDKRRLWSLEEALSDVVQTEDFWRFHANSLAVLVTPDSIRTYRLANVLTNQVSVADRFHLKPLLRAVTYPQNAYILALSENEARVVEIFAEGAPEEIHVPNMPADALAAIGRSSIEATSGNLTTESGSRGPKMRLAQYAKKVDEALRPVLKGSDAPLFLVSTEPLGPIFRSVCSYLNLYDEMLRSSPDRISIAELTAMARPLLDKYHARQLEEVKALFEERKGQQRTATDLADVAKAATYGMISVLLIDFDRVETGFIDSNGNLSFSKEPGAYGVIDEITKRALACNARVLAVRKEDMISDSGAAAILRYPMSL